jgi:hypothetical protein
VDRAKADGRFTGVLVGGSALGAQMDEFSDLDLVLVCRPQAFAGVMSERRAFAVSCGNLLAAFTGEHVGEPALLICLFNDPLLHVDLKFTVPERLAARVEDPLVAWTADGEIEAQLSSGGPRWPNAPPEWFEERFWIWLHYGLQKLGRGEIFEAIEMVGFLRQQILGPMSSRNSGRDQRGVRRVEQLAPEFARALGETLCRHDSADVLRAFTRTMELYRQMRAAHPPANAREEREQAVVDYLKQVRAISGAPGNAV